MKIKRRPYRQNYLKIKYNMLRQNGAEKAVKRSLKKQLGGRIEKKKWEKQSIQHGENCLEKELKKRKRN
jgi:hypothetical protein